MSEIHPELFTYGTCAGLVGICQAEGCHDNWVCRVKGYRPCPAHTRMAIEIFCRRARRKQRGRRQ